MSGQYCYDHPMMSLVVDIVVTAVEGNDLLMVTRKKEPWKGCKALPGGFVDPNETSFEAAVRELHEETGLVAEFLTFVGVYDQPDRDPRGRIVSVAYAVDCGQLRPAVKGMDDVENAEWIDQSRYRNLVSCNMIAADHSVIVGDALGWGTDQSDNPRLINPPGQFFRRNIVRQT
jgi:8-oxo-dGTP diphosphatase